LILSGNTLFGTTGYGNALPPAVFRLNTDGSGFTNIYVFPGPTTRVEPGPLALIGNTLYGVEQQWGIGAWGAIFQINTNGSGFTGLYNFPSIPDYPYSLSNSTGTEPAGFIIAGNILYGTAEEGGAGASGSVYALTLASPSLGIVSTSNQIALTWPASASNCVLQAAADLTSGTWTTITNGISGDGTNFYFTAPATNQTAYFRLNPSSP
jgi:hypothetical protein